MARESEERPSKYLSYSDLDYVQYVRRIGILPTVADLVEAPDSFMRTQDYTHLSYLWKGR